MTVLGELWVVLMVICIMIHSVSWAGTQTGALMDGGS